MSDRSLDRLARLVRARIGTRTRPVSGVALEAVAICADAGFDVLGVGYTRVVVTAGGEQVAKIGWHHIDGERANRTELAVWDAAPAQVRRVLCPCVRLTAGGVLIQQRAEPLLTPSDWLLRANTADVIAYAECKARYADEAREPRRILDAYGIEDIYENQLGYYDGRIVAFDYGEVRASRTRRLHEAA